VTLAGCGTSKLEQKKAQVETAVRQCLSSQYADPWPDDPVTVERGQVTARLSLNFEPVSMRQVQEVTDTSCQAIVDKLMALGINPRKEMIAVFVHARRPEQAASPTGEAQVRVYGKSMYDFSSDKITFKAAQ
jgi:hypothetical protein